MADVARPTQREVLAGLRDVACDLPALVTAPLYRRWHLRWGATPAEGAGSMPGDALLPRAQFRATRAITIDAPPESVWPWMVQVGCLRARFYSKDPLDTPGRPSATTIRPGLQHLQAGQWVPMSPAATPTDRTALKVHSFDVNQWLLWTKPDSTWAGGVRAPPPRPRRDPPGHPHPCRVRLAAPADGAAGGPVDGVRRLRHAPQN